MSILSRRVVATILDYSLFTCFCWVYVSLFGSEVAVDTYSVRGVMAVPIMGYWTLYFVVVEWIFGGTISHRAMGLRVVSMRSNKVSVGQTLKRRLMDAIDLMFFGLPAFILVRNTPEHQRLGDIWAKTKVVRVS